jgi:RNA polymerase sigma-70 factor (ECF subfamily)
VVQSLSEAFRARLPPAVREAFPDDPALEAAISGLHARGRVGWPAIAAVTPERFAGELARRLGTTATLAALDQLHHDIYLAVAATDGDVPAIAACEQIGRREAEFAASRLRATPSQAEETRGELGRLMFTGTDERECAIASFTGRGDLRGYARVIVARALARRIKRDRREVTLDDQVLDGFAPDIAPEVALLREQYRPQVDAALRSGIAKLSDRHRAVLRFHLIEGWSIDQLGERYGVHRATAARWLTAAREELGAHIRAELADRLKISESQVDSIVALVTSRIEVSVERLLT